MAKLQELIGELEKIVEQENLEKNEEVGVDAHIDPQKNDFK